MIFRPYSYFETGCAAYVFGCAGRGTSAVVDAARILRANRGQPAGVQ